MNRIALKLVFFIIFIPLLSLGQNKLIDNKPFQKSLKFYESTSKNEAIARFSNIYNLDKNNSFVAKKAITDKTGISHQRYQQYYKGLLVEFGSLIVHQNGEKIISVNGELYNPKGLNIKPKLSSKSGLQIATNFINAKKYLWESVEQSNLLNYNYPNGDIVIFPLVNSGELRLAYKYDIYSVDPISRNEVYIDANSGEILYKNPIIKHAKSLIGINETVLSFNKIENLIQGNAETKYSGTRTIETTFDISLNKYLLFDNLRGNGIITYNCERIPRTYQDNSFADNDNNWTKAEHANSFQDDAALDAHWGAEKTYDFWKNTFNRNSFDDNNSAIISYVHYRDKNENYANAFWNGRFMTYGDGSGTTNPKAFTSLDICGHEIGHAVCTFTANLAYRNQSGALNEGFSDIWGACVEQYGKTGSLSGSIDPAVWFIGEDITNGGSNLEDNGLRRMDFPKEKRDPDTFQGQYWITTADDGSCTPDGTSGSPTYNDYCGVHTNSGVLNHWFYILTAGKSGTNNAPIPASYNVAGIGMAKAAEIAYLAERDFLTSNSTFFDMREASLIIANNLYCSNSPEVIAVTNAWAAVNIGEKYISYNVDVSLSNLSLEPSLSCSNNTLSTTLSFKNEGLNAINSVSLSYNIDGGVNQNFVWNGNLSPCSEGNFQLSINTENLSRGSHVLNVTAGTTGDGNSLNNLKSNLIYVNKLDTSNTVNTFESNNDSFVSYDEGSFNSVWERGISSKSKLTNGIAGNSSVYATVLTGTYPDNSKSFLVTPCFDLSRIANPVLKFDMAFDLEQDFDVIYMQYSTDNGNSWDILGNTSDSNWYNSNNSSCANCVGSQWTGEAEKSNPRGGTNGTKRQYSKSLAQFGSGSSTPQSNIIFRYVFHSDEAAAEDGAIIDNFVVEGTLSNNNEAVFNRLSIYPNPADTQINISMISELNEPLKVSLFDLQGRLIKNVSFETSISNINELIDISTIPSGFYILKIAQGTLIYNTKIVKK